MTQPADDVARMSLTLCRDIFAQVLRIAEREGSMAVRLLRRTVADLDQQLPHTQAPTPPPPLLLNDGTDA